MILLVTLPPLGCSTTRARDGNFNSDDPAAKLYAITRAGENRDRSSVKHLIDQLGSDDGAVRMMAIIALERIIGTRKGYNPYDSAENRRPAIEAWTQAYRQTGSIDSEIHHE